MNGLYLLLLLVRTCTKRIRSIGWSVGLSLARSFAHSHEARIDDLYEYGETRAANGRHAIAGLTESDPAKLISHRQDYRTFVISWNTSELMRCRFFPREILLAARVPLETIIKSITV